MVGSLGRQKVQQGVLSETEFYAPPLAEQVVIGRTLRALDNKITCNTTINDRRLHPRFLFWIVSRRKLAQPFAESAHAESPVNGRCLDRNLAHKEDCVGAFLFKTQTYGGQFFVKLRPRYRVFDIDI